VPHGGWLPLTIATTVFAVMTTWRQGRAIVAQKLIEAEGPLRGFVEEIRRLEPPVLRPPRAAVFMQASTTRSRRSGPSRWGR
jgi:KUP system potassium uptake protein